MAKRTDVKVNFREGEIRKAFNDRGQRAMAQATTYWKAQTVRHAPVATGQTKQRTQQFVSEEGGNIVGGLEVGTDYASYLIFGANTPAGRGVLQKVKKWKIGDAPITNWQAKSGKGPGVQGRNKKGQFVKQGGGNKNAKLPLALPYIEDATEVLKQKMKG